MNNTLKRLLSLFMVLAMVMSFAVLPAAAEDTDVPTETTQAPQETGHQHDLREEVTLAATCAAAGVKTISCGSDGCSFTEEVEIPATGEHTWDDGVQTKAPTCIEAGVKTFTCSVCGGTDTEEIATVAHTYENGVCTTVGCTAVEPSDEPENGEAEDETPTCVCTVKCGEMAVVTCAVCGTGLDNCIGKTAEEIEAEQQAAAEAAKLAEVEALMAALPTEEEVRAMDWNQLTALNTQITNISLKIDALGEKKSEVDTTGIAALANLLNECVMTLENNTVAMIGETHYTSLQTAFAEAKKDDVITITATGTYTLPQVKTNLTIQAAENVDVTFTNIGEYNTGSASLTFKGVTFTYANGSTYKGLQHSNNMTYNNCTFNGQVFLYGVTETFIDCTFNTTDPDNYNVWTYGAGTVNFNNCTFNSAGKAVLVYHESKGATVNFTDCDLIASQAVSGKAAVEIDSSLLKNGTKYIVNIDSDTTATGFATDTISGSSLWNNKKGVMTEVKVGSELVYDGMNPVEHKAPSITTEATGKTAEEIKASAGINADVDTGLSGVTTSDLESTVVNALSDKTITTPLNLETRLDIQLESIDDDTNVITFDIKPVVTAYNAATGAEVAEATIPNEDLPATGITFRLPVPSSIDGDYVTIVHKHDNKEDEALCKIEGEAPNRYAELNVKSFSKFIMRAPNNYVAVVSGEGCTTLKEAVEKVQETQGEHTIELLKECNEDVTIVQAPGVKITIDGKNNNYTGTITVNGKSQAYDTAGLTIQNVNFDATNISANIDASIRLGGTDAMRYTNHVTVTGCTFTGTGKTKVAVKNYTAGCKNLTITGCTATGMHSLLQVKGVTGLNISGCEITDCKNGIHIGTSVGAVISGCTIENTAYGIRANESGNHAQDLTVENVTITAKDPIVVRYNTAKTYEVTLSGTNNLTATNDNGYTVIFTSGDDGTYNLPTGGFAVTGAANQKVFPGTYEANVGATQCYTLEDALNYAAKHGGEITLTDDADLNFGTITVPETTAAGFTLNLGGKIVIIDQFKMENASTVEIKNGTIKDVSSSRASANDTDTIYLKNANAKLVVTNVAIQGNRHPVRIKEGTVTMNGSSSVSHMQPGGATYHLFNVGDDSTSGHLIINNGTYNHRGADYQSEGAYVVNLQGPGSTATIKDGKFGGASGDILHGNTFTVTGGTFDKDVSAKCADGYYCYKTEDNQYKVDPIALSAEFKWTPDKDYLIDASLIVWMPEGYKIPAGAVATVTRGEEEIFKLIASADNGVAGSNALIFTFANREQINSTAKAPVEGKYVITLTDGTKTITTAEHTITGTHPAAAMTVKSYDDSSKTLTLNVPALLGDYTFLVKKGTDVVSNGQQYCTGHVSENDKFVLTTSTDLEAANGTVTLKNFPTEAGAYTVDLHYRKGSDDALTVGELIKSVSMELVTVTNGSNVDTVLKGSEYSLPKAAEETGKVFKAWKVTIGEESKEYDAEAKFTVTGNATITAVWEVAASIGDTTYDTLDGALAAVQGQTNKTIEVGATAADGTYTIPAGVTISVNGNTVKAVEGTMTMKLDDGEATFTIPAAKDAYLGQAYVNGEFIYITKGKDDESVTVTVNKRGAQNTKGTLDYSGTRIDSDDSGRPVYEITDIDGSATLSNVHIYGSSATMTFKCDGPYELFIGAHITDANGKVVWDIEDGNCAVAPGCTILTLYNDVLKKLPVGAYTMHMFYKHDNVAVVATNNFFVNPVTPTYVADPTNPKTGDTILLPMAVMFTSAAALFVLLMNKKKRA